MLDHVILDVGDLDASKAFYERALAPLGIEVLVEFAEGETSMCGFGAERNAWFWIARRPGGAAGAGSAHVAFHAEDRAAVAAFHEAALAAGGRDHGAPGLREQYHPTYYAAYVLDPDGYNVEAMTHSES